MLPKTIPNGDGELYYTCVIMLVILYSNGIGVDETEAGICELKM